MTTMHAISSNRIFFIHNNKIRQVANLKFTNRVGFNSSNSLEMQTKVVNRVRSHVFKVSVQYTLSNTNSIADKIIKWFCAARFFFVLLSV